jgi:hypothetical protein
MPTSGRDRGLRLCSVNLTLAILGLAATIVAAVAAIGSWRAAAKANQTAGSLATIEQDRHHTELTPQFHIRCAPTGNGYSALMYLTLEGPPGLDRLDEVTLTVLDEQWKDHGSKPLAAGPTQEEVAEVIWGPFRFQPRVDGTADSNGRTARAGQLSRAGQNWYLQSLERTQPPRWNRDLMGWQRQYQDQPMRLAIACRQGDRHWLLNVEVLVPGEVRTTD